jgi:hypothetical protein
MRQFVFILAILMMAVYGASASEVTINPVDAKGIYYESQGFIIDSLSVRKNSIYENRSLLEFDVSGLSGTVPHTTLDLSYGKFYDGYYQVPPSDSIIDVFAYVGDGVVSTADFFAGGLTPFMSFVGDNDYEIGYGYIRIDVTSAVQAVVAAGEQFIGFRLSTDTEAQFMAGWCIGVPDPVLTVTPEPTTVLLLGLGGISLILRKRSRV